MNMSYVKQDLVSDHKKHCKGITFVLLLEDLIMEPITFRFRECNVQCMVSFYKMESWGVGGGTGINTLVGGKFTKSDKASLSGGKLQCKALNADSMHLGQCTCTGFKTGSSSGVCMESWHQWDYLQGNAQISVHSCTGKVSLHMSKL